MLCACHHYPQSGTVTAGGRDPAIAGAREILPDLCRPMDEMNSRSQKNTFMRILLVGTFGERLYPSPATRSFRIDPVQEPAPHRHGIPSLHLRPTQA